MSEVSGGGISIEPQTLRDKYDEIAKIDEQLDAASGSESAGKRALANALSSENEAAWKKPADTLKVELNNLDDPAKLAGVYTGIISSLRDEFASRIDEWLTTEAASRKTDQITLSAEELSALTDSRRELIEQYRALRGILVMFDKDVSAIPEPKKRTGSRGPRGPRVFSKHDFFIDGVARSSSQNSLSSIANTVCSDLGWKVTELRKFLADEGLNLEAPPDEFEYTLPNGHVLRGVKAEAEADEENGEEPDSEDDTEETETE